MYLEKKRLYFPTYVPREETTLLPRVCTSRRNDFTSPGKKRLLPQVRNYSTSPGMYLEKKRLYFPRYVPREETTLLPRVCTSRRNDFTSPGKKRLLPQVCTSRRNNSTSPGMYLEKKRLYFPGYVPREETTLLPQVRNDYFPRYVPREETTLLP